MRKSVAAAGSAAFFVAAPGTVGGLVPWWLTGWRTLDPFPGWIVARVVGVLLIAVGVVVVVHAFYRFVVEGLGTPLPVAAPQRLVVGGFYRFVRNPMYVAILAVILGQALLLAQWNLVAYAAILWCVSATFVRFYEEPRLRREFGADYDTYRHAVPAWLPRLRPWTP
ncbi:methyltransferase family protein [Fodinicola acaciae]|uniref:methyltransferase family protein n=1 Tax=Fodinicola acaciae TaxID=2681555 RepID=UPI0013D61EB9|nr:isoprenylcysteine carboxylmethyltransferase family protein [Fodinicola acaciae]